MVRLEYWEGWSFLPDEWSQCKWHSVFHHCRYIYVQQGHCVSHPKMNYWSCSEFKIPVLLICVKVEVLHFIINHSLLACIWRYILYSLLHETVFASRQTLLRLQIILCLNDLNCLIIHVFQFWFFFCWLSQNSLLN